MDIATRYKIIRQHGMITPEAIPMITKKLHKNSRGSKNSHLFLLQYRCPFFPLGAFKRLHSYSSRTLVIYAVRPHPYDRDIATQSAIR